MFIRFSASAFRKLPSIFVFSYFPFGFEGRMWDLIVSIPDHCLSFFLFLVAFFIKFNTLAKSSHQPLFINFQIQTHYHSYCYIRRYAVMSDI